MNLIVVTDIFGTTTALTELCAKLSSHYNKIFIIDPYDGRSIQFQSEANAYQHFQTHCGLATLVENLETEVVKSTASLDIIGFSVGGSAAWEVSAKEISPKIRNVICFYSSKIREKTHLSPLVPTSLIFPKEEKGFDLDPVIQAVETKQQVEIVRTNYLHGFMNRESENYSEAGYRIYSEWLFEKLSPP